ncbi:MAG: ABC transporter substrate-binding protein [Limnochordales bacterium]|nr:ABC transporter substrate-binding protein [Limnochordales bacterium]
MKRLAVSLSLLLVTLLVAGSLAGAQAPRRGGTLVVALGADPEHLNPALTTSYPAAAVGASLYSALIWLDETGRPQPELAESWEISADGRTYTFHLRRDARWHDGRPVTSADVKYTMENLLGPYHGRFRNAYDQLEGIDTPDDHTVVLRLREPYAPLMTLLTVFDAPILPKHIYEGTDPLNNPANFNNPIGSGPFVFREWVRGDRVVLERNPDYFDEPAYLDRLIYRIIPDDLSRSVALEVGEVDVVWGLYLPASDLPRMMANPDLDVWQGVRIPSLYFVFVNTEAGPLADPKVRQALMHAIDREQVVEQAFMGLGNIDVGPFGAGFFWAYDEASDFSKLYPYDPEKARQLLAEAGVGNLTLRFVFDSARGPFRTAGEIIRDNLRQVGLDLQLVPLERSVMVEEVYTRRAFDLSMQSFTSAGDPILGYHRIYMSAAPGTPFVNATGYSNPQVDALLQEATRVADLDQRAELYRQAAAILAQDLPVLVLFDELATEVSDKRLRGMREALDVRDRLERVWWAE